jgi:hypothetical protein
MSAISARMIAMDAAFEVVKEFFLSSRYAERKFEPGKDSASLIGNPCDATKP